MPPSLELLTLLRLHAIIGLLYDATYDTARCCHVRCLPHHYYRRYDAEHTDATGC